MSMGPGIGLRRRKGGSGGWRGAGRVRGHVLLLFFCFVFWWTPSFEDLTVLLIPLLLGRPCFWDGPVANAP